MTLSEKLAQVLQNQQLSQEAIATINQTIDTETSEINQEVTKLTQTIEEQKQQITDLSSQVEQLKTELTTAEATIDQIAQKQQEAYASEQEAATKISAISDSIPS